MNLAIIATDIRGFSAFSAKLDASRVIELLQKVHGPVHDIVHRHNGKIDKHMGDGLMAYFGMGGENSIRDAISAMTEIQSNFSKTTRELEEEFGVPVKMGVGMAAGMVTLGMLGSETRSELAIVGRTVSLAHRLQDLTKPIFQKKLFMEIGIKEPSCIGITLPDYQINEGEGYRKFSLPAGIEVRTFPEIREVAVIGCQ